MAQYTPTPALYKQRYYRASPDASLSCRHGLHQGVCCYQSTWPFSCLLPCPLQFHTRNHINTHTHLYNLYIYSRLPLHSCYRGCEEQSGLCSFNASFLRSPSRYGNTFLLSSWPYTAFCPHPSGSLFSTLLDCSLVSL